MELFERVVDLRSRLDNIAANGKTVGFVPTMGALHAGHVSLVKRCGEENDFCVVSIFVNPTQFNDPKDLRNYPRNLEKDLALLKNTSCQLIFAPAESEIYPEPDNRVFPIGSLEEVMEGKHRPGHFQGVAKVVSKLFDIVKPNRAYFGEKDYQQIAVIRRMLEITGQPVEIISCPILREQDGLALSSRNMLLTPEHRRQAPLIAKTLLEARNKATEMSVKDLAQWVVDQINANPLLKVEYFEVANAKTLIPINDWQKGELAVGCIAVQAGNVRLIDNVKFDSK